MQIPLPKSPWVGSPSLRAFSSGESRFTIVAAREKDSWLMANLQNNNSGLFGRDSIQTTTSIEKRYRRGWEFESGTNTNVNRRFAMRSGIRTVLCLFALVVVGGCAST